MNVPLYEKIWMWAAGGIIVAFIATVFVTGIGGALQPPSHIETIDPRNVGSDPRFSDRGVVTDSDGRVTVTAVALTFAFVPDTPTPTPAATPTPTPTRTPAPTPARTPTPTPAPPNR